ncbi:hypothetical protein LDENG_00027090 [Xyrichtys novacula]|uniref:Uncharacterized protein n=1 Tax=Xyrichtys novacula TaxID=13765 RepID=A0AAV1FAS4_XYRNO|nr:hypothetical protein LDENG_00027090 [Xyrichtys novacula]
MTNSCCLLTVVFFLIKSTEKDDDYIVLCHHWDRWVLLSLQLLLIKGFTQHFLMGWFDERNSS